ncbi:MAG: hypothetical protein CVV30_00840 [Methanomicrobiales archaeon HGW-Methanomicrobiales-1]|nr:MAG: hypothetical protein CVV30_00840 [Methanomicrobiales archaeon HGW-Methanomicrobiales-1]
MNQATFENAYNISINDIAEFVKFVKDTNKVQFVLSEPPISYAGLDYLDPILEELAPPVYAMNKNYQNTAMQQSFDQSEKDLDSILKIVLRKIPDPSIKSHFRKDYIRQYAFLKHFGFTELSEQFFDTILIDPEFATKNLEFAYSMLVHPLIDPFKANPVVPLEMIQNTRTLNVSTKIDPKNVFIPEVGNFLLKKTTQYPDSLHACKCVIADYKKNDLYSVYSALNEAVIDKNSTKIIENKNELEEIMDNVWHDTAIQGNKAKCKLGVDVICGIVGFSIGSLGGLIGSIGGATAGFAASRATQSPVLDKYVESIAKKIAKPYMVKIYDFQKIIR